MSDIRDVLSGSVHIERIVFACEINHVTHQPVFREEKRIHYYVGASSTDRFLLIEIPSPETANEPVDLLKLIAPAAVARTSDTDFYYNGPLIIPQPRSESNSNLERAFRMMLHPLRDCLQLGLMMAKPGSFHWDDDHFKAEFTDEIKNQHGATFSMSFGKPGESVPESVKEKFLEGLKNPPDDQTGKRTPVTMVQRGFVMDRKVTEPAPSSVEARILGHYATKHKERMAEGVTGQLLRDEQGKVFEIRLDDLSQRVELDYTPSNDLPAPWPCRIRRFIGSPDCETQIPTDQITIYSVRSSDHPVDEATFDLWRYLKAGTYVRGKALPNGHFTLADPKDDKLWRDLISIHDSRRYS